MIALASHGRSGVERFLMGSVAEKVIRAAPVPVFVVKAYGTSLVNRES
jgi:nucleotide-binding universal stress UspA family protein